MMIRSAKPILRLIIPAVLLFLVTALSAAAKEGDPMAEGRERHLNGHGFLPSFYVDDPFVSSTFQTHVGAGMAVDLKTPFRDFDGDVLYVLEGDLVVASLGLGYQQKLGQKWALGVQM